MRCSAPAIARRLQSTRPARPVAELVVGPQTSNECREKTPLAGGVGVLGVGRGHRAEGGVRLSSRGSRARLPFVVLRATLGAFCRICIFGRPIAE
jgi:hypothetical protein